MTDSKNATLASLASRTAIHHAALNLVREAQRCGVVVTIETTPHQPLAMGNHDMSVTVREARRPPPFAADYSARLGTELLGIVRTARSQAKTVIDNAADPVDRRRATIDLPETLWIVEHAAQHALVSLTGPESVSYATELQALRKKVATYEARDALGLLPASSLSAMQLEADNYRWLRDQANEDKGPFIAMGTTHFKECGHTQLLGRRSRHSRGCGTRKRYRLMLIPDNLHFRVHMHGHGDNGLAFYEYEDVQGLGIMINAKRENKRAKWVETFYLRALPGQSFATYVDLVTAAEKVTEAEATEEAAMYPYIRTVAPDTCGNRCRLCPPAPYIPEQGRVRYETTRVTVARCWRTAYDFALSLCAVHAPQYQCSARELLAADAAAREARTTAKGLAP